MQYKRSKPNVIHESDCRHKRARDLYSAFTVAELGEMFQENRVQILKWEKYWYCEAWEDVVDKINPIGRKVDLTEANARAKMLIYLYEHGISKPETNRQP